MSNALACEDSHLSRDVLIKFLQNGIDQRRLADEVRALAAVRSKHVVQLYDVIKDSEGNIVALVEEFLPGRDLASSPRIATAAEFLRISYAIATGIADIHAAGHVHRDIKPNNMKYDAEQCLKIFDFGLSREMPSSANTQGPVGTNGYMAPELCVHGGQSVSFTKAVDAYAFAVTMLHSTLGTLPNGLQLFPPSLARPEDAFAFPTFSLHDEIVQLMARCLAKKAKDRPSMADAARIIGTHLLQWRHRASMVVNNKVYTISDTSKKAEVRLPNLGALEISYNGLYFTATKLDGDVYINNMILDNPMILPGACVVSFGPPALATRRVHVPMDVSHPEVVL